MSLIRGRGHLGLLACLLGVRALVAQDITVESVVIDIRLGRITNATVQAYRMGSEGLLPLSRFFQLAEIRFDLSAEGRLEAAVEPGARRMVIDARSDTVQFGERRIRIERRFIRFDGTELYLGSEQLGT